ncbi:MAG: endonuclease/exonuclease/phosphatase family protein [Deltaproteobacteria bacterium]|nr:endonuclease/exonuclease/phosphatase family protein [Deltaproteobacteria bacterium]
MRRLFGLLASFGLFACGGLDQPPVTIEPPAGEDAQTAIVEAAGPDAGAMVTVDAALLTAPDAATPPATTVRVMTWNTENFFDDVDDPKREDTVVTTEEMDAKTAALAKVIQAQDPDVVSLQEVENEMVLQRLAAQTGLPFVALVPSYDFRGINVAVASRLPIARTVSHLGEKLYAPDGAGPYRWARDCLEVHLTAPDGRELVLLVNHQTSQLDTAAGDVKRQAQANRARSIADSLRTDDPSRAVIIAGDLNDEPSASSIGLLVSDGQWIDVATDVPDAERYTYVYNTPRRYDYLLPDAATAAKRTSVTIVHGDEVEAASDHSPVVATFAW